MKIDVLLMFGLLGLDLA